MFKWFKRKVPPEVDSTFPRPAPARHKRAASSPVPDHTVPDKLPEVVAEGNTQADWSMWEDSMTALDSQMQGLPPDSRIQVRDTRPSKLDDLDPFASVSKKRRK